MGNGFFKAAGNSSLKSSLGGFLFRKLAMDASGDAFLAVLSFVGPTKALDYVSVKWSGYLVPQYTQTYTFTVEADDGVQLFVENQLIIDKFYVLTFFLVEK